MFWQNSFEVTTGNKQLLKKLNKIYKIEKLKIKTKMWMNLLILKL